MRDAFKTLRIMYAHILIGFLLASPSQAEEQDNGEPEVSFGSPEICFGDCGFDEFFRLVEPFGVEDDPRYRENREAFNPNTEEIYSGYRVQDGVFREVVALTERGPGDTNTLCTGTLISRSVVVTAAHCLATSQVALIGESVFDVVEQMRVSIDPDFNFPEAERAVAEGKEADVALLRLEAPVQNTNRIAKIAPQAWIDASGVMRVVGFGDTFDGETGQKLFANINIASHRCEGGYNGVADQDLYKCNPGDEIVARARSRMKEADTCKGDSGGPAFVTDPQGGVTERDFNQSVDRGDYYIAAIVSRGVERSEAYRSALDEKGVIENRCGDGGVYVRLDGWVLRWIRATIAMWGEQIIVAR